ncbi:MAG TPA: bifunctional metallophosphatase/5'-nucleotidase [Steroidobacteraceae bacterium]|nr:bifunctional metallophosphatase/5'-nucleotidase [Steroidobacteraceae bacterium]
MPLLTCLAVCASALAAAPAADPWPPPSQPVRWSAPASSAGGAADGRIELRLLAFNDLHGNLEPPSVPSQRKAGGAAVLAAYLEDAERAAPQRTLILHAGDQVGASPPLTRLLGNEPGIQFLNLLADDACSYAAALQFHDAASWRQQPNRCNVIGTLGNHEFDAGLAELKRLLAGGNAHDGPFLESPYRGSRIPYVCSNVVERASGKLLLPAYAVVVLDGEPVGVIGAVLRETPTIVPAWAVADVEFRDEADSINRAAAELEQHGIHTIVVTIHQGVVRAGQAPDWDWQGPLRRIVSRLDPHIDVVISGHTHHFTNALLPARGGAPVLVTQAYAYGVAYADIHLSLDPRSHEVIGKSAQIIPTWADTGPGLHPDARVAALTQAAHRAVAPQVAQVIARTAVPITRRLSASGESSLGDLVADAQRQAVGADVALMNPGGLRADLPRGAITWGDILTVHPFANRVLAVELTGAQILRVLEEQWPADRDALPRVLKISGLSYSWDPGRPSGRHVTAACDAHRFPIDPAHVYRVAVNDFLVAGGDGFATFRQARVLQPGPLDSEALRQYLARMASAIGPPAAGRIRLAGGGASGCE